MDAYRKTIELDRDKSYWFVDLGPIPGKPDWHIQMYKQVSYAFPSLESATRFAVAHKAGSPQRSIVIKHPDDRVEVVG
jgi:hypothetical protein